MQQNAKEHYTHGLWHKSQVEAICKASYSPCWIRRSSVVLRLQASLPLNGDWLWSSGSHHLYWDKQGLNKSCDRSKVWSASVAGQRQKLFHKHHPRLACQQWNWWNSLIALDNSNYSFLDLIDFLFFHVKSYIGQSLLFGRETKPVPQFSM